MSKIYPLLKGFGKLVVAVSVASSVGYLLLLAINWQDEAPSAEVTQLQQRLVVGPIAENGYQLYLEQAAQLAQTASPALQSVFAGCALADCLTRLAAEPAELEALWDSQSTLLTLYNRLLLTPHWQESVPINHEQLPPYQPLLQGQQLYLLQAYVAAMRGETRQTQLMLDADLQFWRRLLTQNRYLLSKMISVAAIERHFQLAQALAELQDTTNLSLSEVHAWHSPFTSDELGLDLVLAGEWQFADQQYLMGYLEPNQLTLSQRIVLTILMPLYQQQASSNERALLLNHCEHTNWQPSYPWYQWFYNPVGKILNRVGSISCHEYLARLERLEQSRQRLLANFQTASTGLVTQQTAKP